MLADFKILSMACRSGKHNDCPGNNRVGQKCVCSHHRDDGPPLVGAVVSPKNPPTLSAEVKDATDR